MGGGKQARVCFPLSLGKARGVDPPPRGHPVRLATKENVACLSEFSMWDFARHKHPKRNGPRRVVLRPLEVIRLCSGDLGLRLIAKAL